MDWLLIRGLTRERRHWASFPSEFAHRLPAEEARCLDLPGVGTERDRASPWTVAEIAEDVRRRWLGLRAGDPHREWAVLGLSLGGMVALSWCSRHPEDFRRAVLVNTSAGETSSPLRRMRPRALQTLARILIAPSIAEREALVLAMTSARGAGQEEARVGEWARIARDAPVTPSTFLRQTFAAACFRAPPELAVKTLLLSSRGDSLVHPSCSEQLASRYRAPNHVHPSAGHDLPLDDPGWVVDQVRTWLEDCDPPCLPLPVGPRPLGR